MCVTLCLQVCVPFLMLCLGLDPKTHTTNLLSQFHSTTASRESSSTVENESGDVAMETDHTGAGTLTENEKLERSTRSVSEESKYSVGDLLKFLLSIQVSQCVRCVRGV